MEVAKINTTMPLRVLTQAGKKAAEIKSEEKIANKNLMYKLLGLAVLGAAGLTWVKTRGKNSIVKMTMDVFLERGNHLEKGWAYNKDGTPFSGILTYADGVGNKYARQYEDAMIIKFFKNIKSNGKPEVLDNSFIKSYIHSVDKNSYEINTELFTGNGVKTTRRIITPGRIIDYEEGVLVSDIKLKQPKSILFKEI